MPRPTQEEDYELNVFIWDNQLFLTGAYVTLKDICNSGVAVCARCWRCGKASQMGQGSGSASRSSSASSRGT
jgi:hypothetical protein